MTASRSHTFLRYTRLIHLYLGVFSAPALIFFAFTGALQTFSLHETTRGSSYKPPAWATTLAQIHKKQTPVVPARRQPPAEKPSDPAAPKQAKPTDPASPPAPAPSTHHSMPMKIFFLIISIGLFTSTISGIYMSYKYMRNRTVVTFLLVLGVVMPWVFTFI